MENYGKEINIEALTALEMVKRDILPAVTDFLQDTASAVASVKSVSKVACKAQLELIERVSTLCDSLYEKTGELDMTVLKVHELTDIPASAIFYADKIIPAMAEVRSVVDELETIVGADYWPYPTYGDLLFSV